MEGWFNLEFIQVFVVNKAGDAVIIEDDGIIRRICSYQVVTNLFQSKLK